MLTWKKRQGFLWFFVFFFFPRSETFLGVSVYKEIQLAPLTTLFVDFSEIFFLRDLTGCLGGIPIGLCLLVLKLDLECYLLFLFFLRNLCERFNVMGLGFG